MSFDFLRGRPRQGWRAIFLVFAMATLAVILAACDTGNPQSTLDPKGPHAGQIYDLFVPIFWAAFAVFVVVEGVLCYAVYRFRARPGDPLPPQIHGNTRLEVTWTIVPAIILLVILFMTFRTQAALATPPDNPNTINLRVVGHQWWWEFQYPDLGVTTADEMHIPVGIPVRVSLESVDVIHSFWVPQIAGKQDVIPGRINSLVIQADKEGTFQGQCAEFCGIEHALMRFLVVAEPPSQFNSWAQKERGIPAFAPTPTAGPGVATPAAGAATTSLVTKGAQVFAGGACVTCHTIRGTQAQAKVGPDLTHFGGRTSIAANSLPNTPDNLRRWLRNPQAVKPGNDMPNLNLSDDDIDSLVAYLESLK